MGTHGLSDAQLELFCSEGYVVCRRLLSAALVDSWRSQFWSLLECSPDDPSSWPEAAGHHETDIYTPEARKRLTHPWAELAEDGDGPAVDLFPVRPSLDQLSEIRAVVDQLLGAGRWCSGQRPGGTELDTVIFRWPRAPSTPPSPSPMSGHVEGGNRAKGGWMGNFALGAIVYWNDVGPGEGGTVVWPRSHVAAHKYLCEHPDRLATSDGVAAAAVAASQATELTMSKGDVCFWHHWLVHQPGPVPKPGTRPREALFGRWHHNPLLVDKYDIGGIRTDGNLWKHYGIDRDSWRDKPRL
eukprot:SAG31_NODE_4265_length_3394_cov_1.455842_5_plen_298_part_00